MPANFQLEAEADLEAASQYYESQRPGLSQRFLLAVRKTVEKIEAFPDGCPRMNDLPVRRCLLSKFPYSVVYIETEASLEILGIFHQARDPSHLVRRVEEATKESA